MEGCFLEIPQQCSPSPLLVEFGREVVSGPQKMKSVLFTAKTSPSKQESF